MEKLIMLHTFFTIQKISDFFRRISIMHMIGLISKILQVHFLPHAKTLNLIIDNSTRMSFSITAIMTIPLTILFLKKKYPELIKTHQLIWISLATCVSTFFMFLITINHNIKFFIYIIENDHNKNVIYFMIFILTILILDLFHSIKQYQEHQLLSLEYLVFHTIRFIIYKYLILGAAYIKTFEIPEVNTYTIEIISMIKSTSMLFIKLLFYMLIIIWISFYIYHAYSYFIKKNGTK